MREFAQMKQQRCGLWSPEFSKSLRQPLQHSLSQVQLQLDAEAPYTVVTRARQRLSFLVTAMTPRRALRLLRPIQQP